MKILLSGYHNPHFWTITEYMEKAVRSLGHDLLVFDDRNHIIPGRVRVHIPWLHRVDLGMLNKNLLAQVERFHPELAIITGGHRILPDTVKSLNKKGVQTVLWTIDPPIDFQPIIKAAPYYDHIFCQGTEAIELLGRVGITIARWLPMACDPDLHHPIKLSSEDQKKYTHDIVFVGSYYPCRAELFSGLTGFNLAIWGPGWDKLEATSPLRKYVKGAHTTPDQWLKIYNAAKVVLATHYQDPEARFPVYQASPRIFEVLACGAFLISDKQRDVLTLFNEGQHLVTFENSNDLVNKVKYFLNHPDERKLIAKQGYKEALRNHTYVHRVETLLSCLQND